MHVKNNLNRYFLLLLAFVIGISAGAFTVNGLSSVQRDELTNYFQGFLQLLDSHSTDNTELLKIALMENIRIIVVLWVLGVTIIGIPFIFVIISIRGFITGFSSAFIVKIFGLKGILFTLFTLFPKEVIVMPCIIALGVNGINFSLNIIKSKSNKHISKESLKSNFFAYCFVTFFFCSIIFTGILVEAYIIPVFTRMMAPIIIN
jgi:stage II sporulation protein M